MVSHRFAVGIFLFLFLGFTAQGLAVQNYDIKHMTPAIQQALQNRQDRYSEIQKLKAEQKIGEDNEGFLKDLSNTAEVDRIVKDENRDRATIYGAIVEQNNLGPNGWGQVKKVFSEVQREKARPGDWIQEPSGKWLQKS